MTPRAETFTTEPRRRLATAASGVTTTEVPALILGSDLPSSTLLKLAFDLILLPLRSRARMIIPFNEWGRSVSVAEVNLSSWRASLLARRV